VKEKEFSEVLQEKFVPLELIREHFSKIEEVIM